MKRYQIDKTKFLTVEEQVLLKETLQKLQLIHPRDTLIIELLLATGARASELLSIRVSDIDDSNHSLLIKGLKGSDTREIPLPDHLFKRVSGLCKDTTGRVFPISYKRLFQIWKNISPVKKKLHSLRHTFAIELYKKHRDLRLVQIALGHRNISNTMVYAEYIFKTEELRKLIV